jgi:hypothetical protein
MRPHRPGHALAAVLVLAARAAVAAPDRLVSGVVVDLAGEPVREVMVFASDARTETVVGMTVSGAAGEVALSLPRRPHNFGVMSATIGVVRLTPRGPGRFELVTAPLPRPPATPATPDPGTTVEAPRAFVLRGRVVDEGGGGLEGVRIESVRPAGSVATAALTAVGGQFAVMVPGGRSTVRALAPGFKLARSAYKDGRLIVVLAIAAEPQRITITSGRVLSFRPADSLDPEYLPPAPVRAWLQYAYGICPHSGILKAHERREMKKYWYLDVLRREPPNPASISTVNCLPPSQYQQLPPGQTMSQGFEVWVEAALPDE